MSIQEKVLELMTLAMQLSQSGIAHVFINYSGHVDALYVYAYPADHSYDEGAEGNYLLGIIMIYLDLPDVEKRLDDAIAQLTALREQEAA